jgi:hypothetical protein
MSDREAFEKWAEDKSFILCVSSGDGYINVKEMQGTRGITKEAAQAQAVNQQLLAALVNTQAIIEMLYPKINRPDALNLQIIRNKAAIAAAQEVGK